MAVSPSFTPLPQRVRNELAFRRITVKHKTRLAAPFYRITFGGDALTGFSSRGFDDHIKMFFPDPQTGTLLMPSIGDEGIVWPDGPRPVMRDYTPLRFDAQNNLLTVDFYIHDGGVASNWAAAAVPGDDLVLGGPRGSLLVPTGYARQIYICDESGLPAVKRRLEDLADNPTRRALSLYAFTDQTAGESYLEARLPVECHWLGSETMQNPDVLQMLQVALQTQALGEDYFIWITGEGEAVKRLADTLLTTTNAEKDRVRAVAYWHAKAGAH